MSSINVLVVEDFAPFREFVCRQLQRRPDFQISAAPDGLAAVQRAAQLRPDLVLLDIGLPALNGLAAARRIQSVSPESKILFLSRESEPDVVDEALRLGSRGYIDKTCVRYLVPTVEAILDGRLGADATDDRVRPRAGHRHFAQFHSDESMMLESAERILGSALSRDEAAIAVMTRSHLRQLWNRLKAGGRHVELAVEKGSFVQIDADELSSFMASAGVERFRSSFVQTIESAASATACSHPRIALFGECAAILYARGHVDTAMALEALGVEFIEGMRVDLTCAYPLLPLGGDGGFKGVCAHHRAVVVR
jgi:DNA-binding NarL/FixJ family response regulator